MNFCGRLLALSLFLLIGLKASALPFSLLPLTGRVMADVYTPTQNSVPAKPFLQSSLITWLETAPHITEQTYAKFIGEFDGFDAQYSSNSGGTGVSNINPILREGYLASSSSGLEVKAGKLIIPWGKSDVFNPTDYLTAKNLSFFNPDDEVRRLGSFSFLVSYTPGDGTSPWNATTVLTPSFAQGLLLFPPNLIPPNVTLSNPQTPPVTLQNSELAEKISYNGNGWDASVSFFNGWAHQPQILEVNHFVAASTLFVNTAQVYRRITAYGADASYSSEKWVFRFESAYTITPNSDGSNPLELPTHWDSVIGAERPLGDFFRVQAQVLIRVFPRYTSPSSVVGADPTSTLVDQQLAAYNALLSSYQDPTRPGGTLRVSYLNEKNGWDGEIFFLQNFAGGDFLFRPRVSYAWTDTIKSTLGLDLYGGPSNRPLGALVPDSAVFFETKYVF